MLGFILMGINILLVIGIIILLVFTNLSWALLIYILIVEFVIFKILNKYFKINNNKEISKYKTIYWICGEISIFIIIFALREYLKHNQPNLIIRLIYVFPTYFILLFILSIILITINLHKVYLEANKEHKLLKNNKFCIILSFALFIIIKLIWMSYIPETRFINAIYYNLLSYLVTIILVITLVLIFKKIKIRYNKYVFYIGAFIFTFTPIEIYIILYILVIQPIIEFLYTILVMFFN